MAIVAEATVAVMIVAEEIVEMVVVETVVMIVVVETAVMIVAVATVAVTIGCSSPVATGRSSFSSQVAIVNWTSSMRGSLKS